MQLGYPGSVEHASFSHLAVFFNIIIWRFPLRLVISVIEAGVETGLIPLLAMFTHNSVN